MKSSKKATSIVEAMVVMLIVVSGVVGMFAVFNESQQLSNSTANKIQAIQIAREGIEAVKNIRDTNWILYGSDTKNCWNVENYNSSCVGNNNNINLKIQGWNSPVLPQVQGYIVYIDTKNRWKLQSHINNASKFLYSDNWFRTTFKVGHDSNDFYTQSGSIRDTSPLFTRVIKFNYFDTDGDSITHVGKDEKIRVRSRVEWVDSSSTKPHKVEFTTILTNWKK